MTIKSIALLEPVFRASEGFPMNGMSVRGGSRASAARVLCATMAALCAAFTTSATAAANEKVQVAHQFQAKHHGAGNPIGLLTEGPDGALYGVASQGGFLDDGGIFRIASDGAYSVIAQFGLGNGTDPLGDLQTAPNGLMIGVTAGGGSYGAGVVYTIDVTGNRQVYDITGGYGSPGTPLGPAAPNGLYYGIAAYYEGVYVYSVSQTGNYSPFTLLTQDAMPDCDFYAPAMSPLVPDSAGNLYGTTRTCLYVITTAGRARSLFTFTGGYSYAVDVSAGTDGNLYVVKAGEDIDGSCGSLYRFTPKGKHTVVKTWPCYTPAEEPNRAPVQGPDGTLHGLIAQYSNGVQSTAAYRIDRDGKYTEVQVPDSAGIAPTGLIRASDGYYYGNLSLKGKGNAGSVIRTMGGD